MKSYQIIAFLFLAFNFSVMAVSSSAKAQSEEKFFVLPLAGYSSQFGLGLGANAVWLGIDGTPWQATTSAYIGTMYSLSFINLDLINRHLFDFLYLDVGGSFFKTYRALFYGFGNDSSLANETQYSIQSNLFYTKLGVHILESLIIGGGISQRTTGLDRGADPSIPQYQDVFSTEPRLSGVSTTTIQYFISYDTRTPVTAPQEGDLIFTSLEQAQPFNDETLAMQRFALIAEDLWDISDKDLVLVSRFKYDRVWGDDVPFFLQAQIGGQSSLRGYYSGRFIDGGDTVFNFEPRFTFWAPNGSFVTRFELSTALEMGRVIPNNILPPPDGFHADVDFGLTAVLSGNLPLRFDYATSPETTLVYLNLFYPF